MVDDFDKPGRFVALGLVGALVVNLILIAAVVGGVILILKAAGVA